MAAARPPPRRKERDFPAEARLAAQLARAQGGEAVTVRIGDKELQGASAIEAMTNLLARATQDGHEIVCEVVAGGVVVLDNQGHPADPWEDRIPNTVANAVAEKAG